MPMSLPNSLTLLRVLLIPVFVLVFLLPYSWAQWVALAVFSVAAITDWLDGYLARRLNQTSSFGAFLDPVADKLMVATVLLLLTGLHGHISMTLPAMIIISREIAISGLREWMASLGKRDDVAVSNLGKYKTAAQMGALLLLIVTPVDYQHPMLWLGMGLLYIATLLALWSMLEYLHAAWCEMKTALVSTD